MTEAIETDTVLIPLNSGLAWSLWVRYLRESSRRLNPFEFRAGLEQVVDDEYVAPERRLNPFEFRAGLEQYDDALLLGTVAVLIPLNSGLAWSCPRTTGAGVV